MKKYPYVKQDSSNDCGLACLEMVIRYYKGYVPKSILIKRTHTTRSGTTAYYMIETLKQFGFHALGVSCSLNHPVDMIFPCIAHITLNQTYQHYVVIYGIDWKKRSILIADPASKIHRMKLDEFLQLYNQTLIILYPVQKIPIYQKSYSILTYTLKIIQQYWKIFLPVCFLSIIVFILSLVGTFYVQMLFQIPTYFLTIIILVFLIIELMKHLFSYFRGILISRLHQKLATVLSKDAFSRVMKLPYLQYHNLPTGDFMSRMQDIYLIQETVANFAFTLLFDCILFLLSLFFLFYLEPSLCLICLLLCIFNLAILKHFRWIHQNNVFVLEQEHVKVQTFMSDYMRGFEMVKGLSLTNQVLDSFEKHYQNYTAAQFQLQKQMQKENLYCSILEGVGYLGFLAVGFSLYHKGQLDAGMLFTYQLLFSYVMSPIVQLIDSDFLIERAKRAMTRIYNLASEEKRIGIQEKIETIACKNLRYAYQEGAPTLNLAHFEWKKGQKILIMGPSGSGKSTLLKCIKGYYPLEKSMLFLNGKDINTYDLDFVDQQVRYLSQNETLVIGSVFENVSMFDSSLQIEERLKLCEVDKIVQDNPLKYQMLVEENGCNFSGGERAQIILARTLLKPFQVLLIDEGFGQMDINLERRILKRMFATYPEKIIVVISHRKDNMDLYDQVIEMKDGMIVNVLERGE